MKLLLPVLATLTFAGAIFADDAAPNTLTDAEKKAGWKLLFDGKDAGANWRGYKKDTLPAEWKVEEGALVRHGGGDASANWRGYKKVSAPLRSRYQPARGSVTCEAWSRKNFCTEGRTFMSVR